MTRAKEQFVRAAGAVEALIGAIPTDKWDVPTPCDKWTVRDVVNHLVGGNLVVAARFSDRKVPDHDADHIGDAKPAAAFRASAEELLTTLDIPDVLAGEYVARSGAMSGEILMHLRIIDLLVHAWDLMRATGLERDLPTDLAAQERGFVQDELPNVPNSDKFYGPPQPVPDNAPVLDRLVAFTGRTISPT